MWIVEQYDKPVWNAEWAKMLIRNGKCEVKNRSISIVSFPMNLKSLNPILVMLILFWFHLSFFYYIDLSIHSNEYSSSLPAYVIGFIWHSDSIWLLDSFLRYEVKILSLFTTLYHYIIHYSSNLWILLSSTVGMREK